MRFDSSNYIDLFATQVYGQANVNGNDSSSVFSIWVIWEDLNGSVENKQKGGNRMFMYGAHS